MGIQIYVSIRRTEAMSLLEMMREKTKLIPYLIVVGITSKLEKILHTHAHTHICIYICVCHQNEY